MWLIIILIIILLFLVKDYETIMQSIRPAYCDIVAEEKTKVYRTKNNKLTTKVVDLESSLADKLKENSSLRTEMQEAEEKYLDKINRQQSELETKKDLLNTYLGNLQQTCLEFDPNASVKERKDVLDSCLTDYRRHMKLAYKYLDEHPEAKFEGEFDNMSAKKIQETKNKEYERLKKYEAIYSKLWRNNPDGGPILNTLRQNYNKLGREKHGNGGDPISYIKRYRTSTDYVKRMIAMLQ